MARGVSLPPTTFRGYITDLEDAFSLQLRIPGPTHNSVKSVSNEAIFLRQDATRLLKDMDGLVARARGLGARTGPTLTGVISVGCYPAHVESFIGPVLGLFRKANPDVHVDLTHIRDNRSRFPAPAGRLLASDLRNGLVDLVMAPDFSAPGILAQEAYTAKIVAMVSKGHKARKAETISIEDLADTPLLMAPSGYYTRTRVEEAASAAGVRLTVEVESGSPAALVALGESGLGVPVIGNDYPSAVSRRTHFPTVTAKGGSKLETKVFLHCLEASAERREVAQFLQVAGAYAEELRQQTQ